MGADDRPRIALIDDDEALLEALSIALTAGGFEVVTAPDGARGLELCRRPEVRAVVSDVNMPGLDGFTLCRRLREEGRALPILLLTSRDGEIDEALGLDLGADDYLTKPFSIRVLTARLRALLRRASPRVEAAAARLEHGPLSLDVDRLEVRYQGERLEVTVTEFRLLEAMARRPGVLFSRERLLELAREEGSFVAPRLVDTYVARLRRKLRAVRPEGAELIETVIGAGYRLRDR